MPFEIQRPVTVVLVGFHCERVRMLLDTPGAPLLNVAAEVRVKIAEIRTIADTTHADNRLGLR